MRQRVVFAAFTAAVVALVVGVGAQGARSVRADLSGLQEDPSISTTGNGSFTAKIDDDAQVIEYQLTYAGLEGGTTAASHIHIGSHDHNGGVSAFLCGGGGKPACPNVEGTVTGTIVPADVVGPAGQGVEAGSWTELVSMIRAGHTYVNVHTTPRWPGGEIRGQIRNNDQREGN